MPTPKSGYHLADGTEVPGVTTILGRFKDSGGLLFWAFNQGKSGARTLYEKRDQASDTGTHVHAMVEADLHGQEPPAMPEHFTDEMRAGALSGFRAYKENLKRTKAFVMPLEVQLVSEEYRFGGTPDGIVEFEGIVDMADWKTSNGVYLDYIVQGAAYIHLWNTHHPESKCTGLRIFRFGKESGTFAEHYYPPETLEIAWRQFVLFREAFDLDKVLKKRV